MIGVGTLTTGVSAEVDADGTVHQGSLKVGWRVRSGNEWLAPDSKRPGSLWQSRPHPAPVVHTALRVRGGEAIERVYAVGDGDHSVVVIEVENDSPEALAVGFVVDEAGTRIDGRSVLALGRPPGAVEDDNGVVFPVPHRTKVRVALASRSGVDVRALADADSVGRAWDRLLDRGLRTELPEPLQTDVDVARADLLLAPPSADAFAALEAWGFDEDAVGMWERLPMRARQAAKRATGTGVLGEIRAALLRSEKGAIEIVPGFRPAWLGQSIAAHDVPLRAGPCSFAVRWHGARPALLWDVPAGFTVQARALDPDWSSTEPVGDTLLAEPPAGLLAMGTPGALTGTSVDAPDQFS
jgi:hypothetical protein